ncbi:cobalamin biosynthesis protein CobQ [Yoonia sp. 208BN28-4]|uniref:cobalamin biosynthesis protein CobQ n=1 Tax=Yoonia sp. 208BN28-4 TaxID=3126505 RepID=UPI0030A45D46
MNTPAHLIFGLTAFGTPRSKAVTAAALIGSLIPDLSLYLLVAWEMQVMGTPPRVVFGEMYFSESWQSIFRIDNSMVLWGIALAIAIMVGSKLVIALTGAAMLHLMLDFPLHHDDGRAHFWPISNWIFESPVSYWDGAHYGDIVSIFAVIAVLICVGFLWRRFHGLWMRGLILAIGLLELAPAIIFGLMF